MYGINVTSSNDAIALVLLFLYPVSLWIAYKLDYIYSEKKKKKCYMALKELYRQKEN